MPSAWDEPAAPRTGGAGGDFLKVEAGASVTLAVLGEPIRLTKPPFQPGDKPRKRVYVLVYDFGSKKALVWDMAPSTFEDVKAIHKDAPLSRHAIKLSREGAGLDTRWRAVPVVKPLTPAAFDEIGKAARPDLEAIAAATGELDDVPAPAAGGAAPAAPIDDDKVPF